MLVTSACRAARLARVPAPVVAAYSTKHPIAPHHRGNGFSANQELLSILEKNLAKSMDITRFTKKFQPRQTYSLRDLDEESNPPKVVYRKKPPTLDVFQKLGANPLHEYKNIALLSEFVTGMGKIKSRHLTGLNNIHQRRVARLIKRARAMGLMPYTHRKVLMNSVFSHSF